MMNMKIKMIKLSDGDVLDSISQAEKQWRLYFSSITDKFVIKNKQFLGTSKCGSPVYIVIKKTKPCSWFAYLIFQNKVNGLLFSSKWCISAFCVLMWHI